MISRIVTPDDRLLKFIVPEVPTKKTAIKIMKEQKISKIEIFSLKMIQAINIMEID